MKKKSAAAGEYRFIILIPGRDTEKLLDGYRAALFAKGVYGAYSFPPAAPLAELSRPFSRDELKELAGIIRKLTMAHDGKISGSECCSNTGFGDLSFFGPKLDIPAAGGLLSETARGKIARALFPPILCAALVHSGSGSAEKNPQPEKGPAFSFRAAALANLAIRPLPGGGAGEASALSFEWRIGPPVWLPAYKKAKAEK
jgi:hypothetical protein